MYKNIYLLLGFFACFVVQAQIGGVNTYSFLDLPSSSRINALSRQITIMDSDPAMFWENPASSNILSSKGIAFSNAFFFNGINAGSLSYNQYMDQKEFSIHGGFRYVSYGDFESTDELGNVLGTFSANDYVFQIGASKALYGRLQLGASIKWIQSSYETYSSSGLAGDFGLIYHLDEKNLNIGLVAKNMGLQLSTYSGVRESIPFDLQLAISKRLEHLPFRFTFLYHHLHRWNILYDDPSQQTNNFLGSEDVAEGASWFTQLMSHVVISGEFLFGKKENLRLHFSYDGQQRREMNLSYTGIAGFAFGAEVLLKRFRFGFSSSSWHLGQSMQQVSVATNFVEFKKKSVLPSSSE